MYRPQAFREDDAESLAALMSDYSFATLVTHNAGRSHASHVPVLHRPAEPDSEAAGTLWTHLARANDQWRHLEQGEEALVIFAGPHAYISPAWYASGPAVPTWNYMAAHVYGTPRIVSDTERLREILEELVEFHEARRPQRWDGKLPPEFRDRLLASIVGVEIKITRVEGVSKLSQNRPQDIPGVVAALAGSDSDMQRELARQMRKHQPMDDC